MKCTKFNKKTPTGNVIYCHIIGGLIFYFATTSLGFQYLLRLSGGNVIILHLRMEI